MTSFSWTNYGTASGNTFQGGYLIFDNVTYAHVTRPKFKRGQPQEPFSIRIKPHDSSWLDYYELAKPCETFDAAKRFAEREVSRRFPEIFPQNELDV